jgi:hypothetical protein
VLDAERAGEALRMGIEANGQQCNSTSPTCFSQGGPAMVPSLAYFRMSIASLLLVLDFAASGVNCGAGEALTRPRNLVPNHVVGEQVWVDGLIPSIALEGYSLSTGGIGPGLDGIVFFRCLDRMDRDVSLSIRLFSQQETYDYTVARATGGWSIGEIVTQSIAYQGSVQGLYNLQAIIGKNAIHLGTVEAFDPEAFPGSLADWEFYSSAGRWGLKDALTETIGISLYPPNTIGLALEDEARTGTGAGVAVRRLQPAGMGLRWSVELFDGYALASYPGHLEQRLYLNDKVVHRHDLSGDTVYGWYPVVVEVPSGPTRQEVEVRVELTALVDLEAWGWGRLSKTLIRNLEVVPAME